VQATFLQDLNSRGSYDAVIRHFERGGVVSSEATLGEYVKALAKADKLDNSSLLRTLQVGEDAHRMTQ
jgi:ATP-dependent metalloprotease